MGVPVRNKGNSSRQSAKTNAVINRAVEQKDPHGISSVFPNPKIVDSAIIGRHTNKAAFMIAYDSPDYQAKSEITVVAGALGAAQSEIIDEKPVTYGSRNRLDAAHISLSEATNTTNIKSLVGEPNYRSHIGLVADTVKTQAREILELSAGGQTYLANSAKTPSPYGAVHIIAGDRTNKGDLSLQPLVKGSNLVKFLKEQVEFIQNLTSVQQAIIEDILQLKIILTAFGGACSTGPFSITPASIALVSAVGVSTPKSAIALANNLGVGVNKTLLLQNYLEPYSPEYILSRFNKVN